MFAGKPSIVPTSGNRFFWEGGARHELWITRCTQCALYVHPPMPCCPRCAARTLTPARMSGHGVVYSFTIVRRVFHPGFADDVPYVVAMVELDEQPGLYLITRLMHCPPEAVSIGMRVSTVFGITGQAADGLDAPMFEPVPDSSPLASQEVAN